MQGPWYRTSQISRLFLPALFLLVVSCAASRPDIIQVGPWFPEKPAGEVRIFSSKEETDKPWGAIAIIHSEKIPAEDRAGLDRQRKMAREMAAGIGADGLIISEETVTGAPQLGIYTAPETFISALAFKYAANVSTSVPEGSR